MGTAIVILNWNGRTWLERFLPGVIEHRCGATVVVADNGSTDDSLDWLERTYPTVQRITLPSNLGFAGGYNAALAEVDAERYLLLNSDVQVTPGWLDRLNAYLDRDPGMAACQPKVLAHGQPGHFEHAGAAGGYIDRNGYPFCRGRIFEITEQDAGQYDDEQEVFWATGACLLIRAAAFHEAGGFDAALFAHMEEIDLCWRLRRMGWRIGYTSQAMVHHVGGGSLGYSSPHKTYLNFRNSLIVLTKNLHNGWSWWWLFRRLVLDGFAALKFLLEGHAAHAWQVGRAHRHFFLRLPQVIRQRRELMATEREPDLTGMYHRSIAYDRFILGWKRFEQLDKEAFR
ncbi:MAG: glycosyltransferase family 2 protein [Flavobacteriales bacterium]|jgi:GT2 family glycosyltransferase|nr:glycosyltransferase family 2 protein [Flavobacteriales bacterium]MBK6882177.1 glycosyltransferase family 2 protein [Flavobacteriales bacterium]MBK7101606.1 glycosyltransferase family 2 protein [Flavobacteriales bacterium]MBK7112312.1 glycosyltransferase family 2 protein [Flavobacteriales bacterium]MBK7618664.1 glycosyltransferase family 2 protein [Flavobacteriales bacterium]